jgi:hypothetical protein
MTDARADDLTALRLLDEPARRRLYDWVATQDEPVGREQAAAATGLSRSTSTSSPMRACWTLPIAG